MVKNSVIKLLVSYVSGRKGSQTCPDPFLVSEMSLQINVMFCTCFMEQRSEIRTQICTYSLHNRAIKLAESIF